MKTCNGCSHLYWLVGGYVGEIVAIGSEDEIVWFCGYKNSKNLDNVRIDELTPKPIIIGKHKRHSNISTPDWCPKEAQRC